MTSASAWRRRCIAAEERASSAERAARRAKRRAQSLENDLEFSSAHAEWLAAALTDAERALERLAEIHLGTRERSAVKQLVDVWVGQATKKRRKERLDGAKEIIDEMMRRLGELGIGDDTENDDEGES